MRTENCTLLHIFTPIFSSIILMLLLVIVICKNAPACWVVKKLSQHLNLSCNHLEVRIAHFFVFFFFFCLALICDINPCACVFVYYGGCVSISSLLFFTASINWNVYFINLIFKSISTAMPVWKFAKTTTNLKKWKLKS